MATGSQWNHECLYITKKGQIILRFTSNVQGTKSRADIITRSDAAQWLAKQGLTHELFEKEISELEV